MNLLPERPKKPKEQKRKKPEEKRSLMIVGKASEELKNEFAKSMQRFFAHHRIEMKKLIEIMDPENEVRKFFEMLTKNEIEKSKDEIKIINLVNEVTSEIMKSLGLTPFNIPLGNYYLLPHEVFKEIIGKNIVGTTLFLEQAIVISDLSWRRGRIPFTQAVLHETLHLKGFITVEAGESIPSLYRLGVTINSLQEYMKRSHTHEHFSGLHEAIISEATKRLLFELLKHPTFKKEAEKLNFFYKTRKKIAEKFNVSVEDVIWFEPPEIISYPRHREFLIYLCQEIHKQFPERYPQPDDVFKEFLKAHFTGNLLTVARLIEATFGKASFRILGNMDTSSESAVSHLETFKKLRREKIKESKR